MAILSVENLSKSFGGVTAVKNCTFSVEENTITGIIGPNGAGKSTLFDLITGYLKPDSGDIHFLGESLLHHSEDARARLGISRMFQQSRLFDYLSVQDNLELALYNNDTHFWRNLLSESNPPTPKILRDHLDRVAMTPFKDNLAMELSYGQKRLVELARSLIKSHFLLMLDEPVAGLSPNIRAILIDILKVNKEAGETILLIEHDMDFTLNVCDQIIVLHEGTVIANDTPKKIRKNKQVVEAYLGGE